MPNFKIGFVIVNPTKNKSNKVGKLPITTLTTGNRGLALPNRICPWPYGLEDPCKYYGVFSCSGLSDIYCHVD